jgi:hypothetical protein
MAYVFNNPVLLVDPEGEAGIAGAIWGGLGGFVSDIAIQAAANMMQGDAAFSNISLKSAFVSAGVGAATGAIGIGIITQSKKAYKSFKAFSRAYNNVKAREIATAAGKYRNAERTAIETMNRNRALGEVGVAVGLGAAGPVAKGVITYGIDKYNSDYGSSISK